jgi:DNA-binding protein Fis
MHIQIDLHALIISSEQLRKNSNTNADKNTHKDAAFKGAYSHLLAQIEPAFLQSLLAFTHNNKSRAARVAGINISTLERKLNRYGMVVNKIVAQKIEDKQS